MDSRSRCTEGCRLSLLHPHFQLNEHCLAFLTLYDPCFGVVIYDDVLRAGDALFGHDELLSELMGKYREAR